MSSPGREKGFQIGEYWLSKQARSNNWCRTWFDKATGQVRRVSLRSPDAGLAKERLTEWFVAQHTAENAPLDEIAIAEIVAHYWRDHGQHLPSASSVKTAVKYWVEYWDDASVAAVTGLKAQEEFHNYLSGRGLANSSINRVLMVGKAALNRAWKNGEITGVPKIISLPQGDAQPQGRPLTIKEVQALLDHCPSEYLRRFILLMIGTASRPDAIRELQKDQCDLDAGIIMLNRPGRRQTKKYRATVRLPRQLVPMLENAEDGYLITYRGRPVKSLKGAWRNMREKAGLDRQVNPYSIRHTMAKYLRASGVSAWDVSCQLGHRQTGMSITEKYASADPAYLAKACEAIEGYLQSLKC